MMALRRVSYLAKQPLAKANGKEKTRMTMGPSYVLPDSTAPSVPPLIIAIITERLGGILRGRGKGQACVSSSAGA